MGSKKQTLVEILDDIASLLRRYGRNHWASWVESDRDRLHAADFSGIRHFLSAFGGMGSLQDVVFHPSNGDTLSPAEASAANAKFTDLLSRAYDLATELSRDTKRE